MPEFVGIHHVVRRTVSLLLTTFMFVVAPVMVGGAR